MIGWIKLLKPWAFLVDWETCDFWLRKDRLNSDIRVVFCVLYLVLIYWSLSFDSDPNLFAWLTFLVD